MDKRKKPKVGFIPCLTFVRQGVANSTLEKLKATKEELQQVVKELKLREAEYRHRPKEEQQPIEGEPMSDDDVENENNAVDDYYDLDNYDDEPVESGMSYNTDALLLNSAPESESEDDSDEEVEDFTVKPDDNLIVAGQVSDDVCLLQLYVLNVEKQEFFLLNDTYLPSYPVSLEWLDFNPSNADTPAHLAAVGYMMPEIHVWDLNKSDCLEPLFTLGSKKQKKTLRHRDAVMDLAWNTSARNVLASGSADQTVILWDIKESKSVTKLECFVEKVQSIQWHPLETQSLLTGVCDGAVKLFDCGSPGTNKSWQFEGEIERVMWNKFDPLYFFASTEKGMVHYVDIRAGKPVWNLNAHGSAVGGLALSSFCRDFLVTGSQDEMAKVWDIKDSSPTYVTEKEMKIGHIYAITACQDSPYVFAAGGANPDNHLYVWDARESQTVVDRFKDRFNIVVDDNERPENEKMDDGTVSTTSPAFQFKQKERTAAAVPTPSTSAGPSHANTSVKDLTKKKKKKKKKAQ